MRATTEFFKDRDDDDDKVGKGVIPGAGKPFAIVEPGEGVMGVTLRCENCEGLEQNRDHWRKAYVELDINYRRALDIIDRMERERDQF